LSRIGGKAGTAGPRIDEQMRKRVSAYPGTLTFLDLIAKNKRDSAVLMVFMVTFGVVVGGVLASAVAVYFGAAPNMQALLPSIILGGLAALVFGVFGAAWSWFGGSSAILMMSGAKEITKPLDPELFNVVEELAIAGGIPCRGST